MWSSSFYGLAVDFPLFVGNLSPMAYSSTFNLLALLCTPPSGGKTFHVVYCQFLFTFQVCTTRFNNKTKFFGHLFVLWKMSEWNPLFSDHRAEGPPPRPGSGVNTEL